MITKEERDNLYTLFINEDMHEVAIKIAYGYGITKEELFIQTIPDIQRYRRHKITDYMGRIYRTINRIEQKLKQCNKDEEPQVYKDLLRMKELRNLIWPEGIFEKTKEDQLNHYVKHVKHYQEYHKLTIYDYLFLPNGYDMHTYAVYDCFSDEALDYFYYQMSQCSFFITTDSLILQQVSENKVYLKTLNEVMNFYDISWEQVKEEFPIDCYPYEIITAGIKEDEEDYLAKVRIIRNK